MLLLHWSKGYFDCQVTRIGSGKESVIEVNCSEKTTPKTSATYTALPSEQFSSFDQYWESFTRDQKWFTSWPVYIHPELQSMIQASINRISLKELSSSEFSYLDKWKTYLHFRIPVTR